MCGRKIIFFFFVGIFKPAERLISTWIWNKIPHSILQTIKFPIIFSTSSVTQLQFIWEMLRIFGILRYPAARIKDFLLLLSILLIIHLVFHLRHPIPLPHSTPLIPPSTPLTTFSHIVFSISSSSSSLPSRAQFIRLWYSPNSTPYTYVFIDKPLQKPISTLHFPSVILSSDTSRFPYTFPRGNPSAIRIARVVKDVFTLANPPPHIRWFVFGDDDTVFFKRNLLLVLSKYDHEKWFYIGFGSESYEQNEKFSFGMAFGGGGFALSAPLARVLAGVLDSCLVRYPHLYGSDSRIFACLSELGVELTREPGFHQVSQHGTFLLHFSILCQVSILMNLLFRAWKLDTFYGMGTKLGHICTDLNGFSLWYWYVRQKVVETNLKLLPLQFTIAPNFWQFNWTLHIPSIILTNFSETCLHKINGFV